MGQDLEAATGPVCKGYLKFCTINCTDLSVLQKDPQCRPPAAWCTACGGEVYRPGRSLCRRCGPENG